MNRRQFCQLSAGAALTPSLLAGESSWKPNYVLSSAMFGNMPLESVVGEISKAGCDAVDIWRKGHATHREQIDKMGDEAFQEMLKRHGAKMAVSTCYPLGPFKQDDEIRWVDRNGGHMTVCGSGSMGEKDPLGAEAKKQVKAFFEKLRPHYELAEE